MISFKQNSSQVQPPALPYMMDHPAASSSTRSVRAWTTGAEEAGRPPRGEGYIALPSIYAPPAADRRRRHRLHERPRRGRRSAARAGADRAALDVRAGRPRITAAGGVRQPPGSLIRESAPRRVLRACSPTWRRDPPSIQAPVLGNFGAEDQGLGLAQQVSFERLRGEEGDQDHRRYYAFANENNPGDTAPRPRTPGTGRRLLSASSVTASLPKRLAWSASGTGLPSTIAWTP